MKFVLNSAHIIAVYKYNHSTIPNASIQNTYSRFISKAISLAYDVIMDYIFSIKTLVLFGSCLGFGEKNIIKTVYTQMFPLLLLLFLDTQVEKLDIELKTLSYKLLLIQKLCNKKIIII